MLGKIKIFFRSFCSINAYCFHCHQLFKIKIGYIIKHGTQCYFCGYNEGFALNDFAVQQYVKQNKVKENNNIENY